MRKGDGLTEFPVCATPAKVGRKLEWPEKWLASFAKGTLARLDAVKADGEDRRSIIRDAVNAELKRRERKPKL